MMYSLRTLTNYKFVHFQHSRFDDVLKACRLQKRGTGGEHTPVVDHTYDISNSERLGKSEVRLFMNNFLLLLRVWIVMVFLFNQIERQY